MRIEQEYCDNRLLEGVLNMNDPITKKAMEIYGVTEEKVTPKMRRNVKPLLFGELYGKTSTPYEILLNSNNNELSNIEQLLGRIKRCEK